MITLEIFGTSDIQRLIDWIPDSDFLLQWAGPEYVFPLDEAQLNRTLEKTRSAHPSHFMFKAMLNSVTVGHVEIMAVDYVEKRGVLARILIGPKNHRGKGWGKSMIQSALNFAFNDLALDNLDLGVFKFNKAAVHCYKQLGFEPYITIPNLENDKWTLLRMNLNRITWQRAVKGN